ncbi:hypothetical protein EYF80_018611 [Liparis tanakae]|uniref:Uncharacterized protein n=1 Tax=Liparis tanakae TaxID=230148 RepID=A0A4Z2HZU7_9TELE|nr:hypothetical protein EYF80_018611 [Liparis tanakae]
MHCWRDDPEGGWKKVKRHSPVIRPARLSISSICLDEPSPWGCQLYLQRNKGRYEVMSGTFGDDTNQSADQS